MKIEYRVWGDAAALAAGAAEHLTSEVEQAVAERGVARVALSGGSTPRAALALLADAKRPWFARMPWRHLELFWVDERCVGPEDAESNYRMTREAFLDQVPMEPGQIHRIEGELEPEEAAARYEAELRRCFRLEGAELPRFDVVALGMGPDGHTASIFPSTEAIYEMMRIATANYVPQKSSWRVTLSWPAINAARRVFFLIGGAEKAGVLREVVLGKRDVERLPSQLIRPSGGILTLLLDRGAAAELPATDRDGRGRIAREEE